jgi:hypothetical protein
VGREQIVENFQVGMADAHPVNLIYNLDAFIHRSSPLAI